MMYLNRTHIYVGKSLGILLLIALHTLALNTSAQDTSVYPDNYNIYNNNNDSPRLDKSGDLSFQGTGYSIMDLKVNYLPNLNTPRVGHVTMCLNGELTVFGGHTNGFVPSATAEYLHDGAWHSIPLAYAHDHGTAIHLRSGKVFMAGGHKEELGIGQQFCAELYDPATHRSQGFGCMDKKRAFASAIEMSDGEVILTGNWHSDDGIEIFSNVYDPLLTNATHVKDASTPRARPYILRISKDDAIIFGSFDNVGNPAEYSIVDRLKGPAYREPFLDTWHPIYKAPIQHSLNQFIGNEANGVYEWLLPVENKDSKSVAIARVTGPSGADADATFSLLQVVPNPIRGKDICYSSLICDLNRGLAYLIGDDDEARIYVVAVNYNSSEPAPLNIYITDPQPISAQSTMPVLTSEGDLVFTGGCIANNFAPSNTVIRLPLGQKTESAPIQVANTKADTTKTFPWWWTVIAIAIVFVFVIIIVILLRRKRGKIGTVTMPTTDECPEETAMDKNLIKEEVLVDLFGRIEQLMEKEQLYLNANLRASDVAARVGSNTAYVSAAINTQRKCSISQYLASYRIAYAQNMMRQKPDSKISNIGAQSGFSTDSTFFRAFRTVTGMSPKEWLSGIRD